MLTRALVCLFILTLPVTAAAQAPATTIVAGKSVGDLTLDMSLAEIKERLGTPDDCGASSDPAIGSCSWVGLGSRRKSIPLKGRLGTCGS